MVAKSAPDRDDPTGLDAAIAAYLAACDVEGKSPRTVQAYRETLSRFLTICAAGGLPDRVAAFRPADLAGNAAPAVHRPLAVSDPRDAGRLEHD